MHRIGLVYNISILYQRAGLKQSYVVAETPIFRRIGNDEGSIFLWQGDGMSANACIQSKSTTRLVHSRIHSIPTCKSRSFERYLTTKEGEEANLFRRCARIRIS